VTRAIANKISESHAQELVGRLQKCAHGLYIGNEHLAFEYPDHVTSARRALKRGIKKLPADAKTVDVKQFLRDYLACEMIGKKHKDRIDDFDAAQERALANKIDESRCQEYLVELRAAAGLFRDEFNWLAEDKKTLEQVAETLKQVAMYVFRCKKSAMEEAAATVVWAVQTIVESLCFRTDAIADVEKHVRDQILRVAKEYRRELRPGFFPSRSTEHNCNKAGKSCPAQKPKDLSHGTEPRSRNRRRYYGPRSAGWRHEFWEWAKENLTHRQRLILILQCNDGLIRADFVPFYECTLSQMQLAGFKPDEYVSHRRISDNVYDSESKRIREKAAHWFDSHCPGGMAGLKNRLPGKKLARLLGLADAPPCPT
jgi:hypothetical protein